MILPLDSCCAQFAFRAEFYLQRQDGEARSFFLFSALGSCKYCLSWHVYFGTDAGRVLVDIEHFLNFLRGDCSTAAPCFLLSVK